MADALHRALELRPDAVLVDVGLPDGDGFALARQLMALLGAVRVVLTSSETDRAGPREARDAGARGFVAKDDMPGALLRRLLEGT